MGNFLGSTHVKTETETDLKDFISKLAVQENFECFISPSINGWVSIFRDQFGQIPLGESIANQFDNNIIDVMVHDDDVFCYWYLKNGQLIDSFNSCPDYFGEMDEDTDSSQGNPEVFKDLLDDPKKIEALKHVLHQKPPLDNTSEPKQSREYFNNIKEFLNDPEKMFQFAEDNDLGLKEKIASILKQIPEEATQEVIVNLVNEKPELLN